jgi:anti-sigma-K factor RskA
VYHAPQWCAVEVNVPELEQRLLNLQWQLDRLWQAAEGNVQSVEQRLAGMADQYAENLKRWAVTAERHSRTVTQLESYVAEWKDANGRIQQDTFQRLRELETVIQHEWDALKKIHEQPVKELREQAANLTEVCIATASVARQGFDRAEARLASFEEDVHLILGEFGRDLQSVLAEMKARPGHQARLDGAPPWSLDDVTRLHSQLRESADGSQPMGSVVQSSEPQAARALLELPPATTAGTDASVEQPLPWKWRLAVVGLALAVITTVAFGWYLQNQVSVAAGRARQAEFDSQRAAADAARQAAAAREEAAREVASAREMANRAQQIGNVLAAPDLIRYSLSAGTGAPGASGQALWSRTRGFVFSGSRLPPPPPNGSHQVWLLTRVAPFKASTFMPEPDGTVTLVEQGLNVPRAVVGVMVTAEPGAGGESPSGDPILTSVTSVQ